MPISSSKEATKFGDPLDDIVENEAAVTAGVKPTPHRKFLPAQWI
jgi:hypothetical protein